MIVYRVQDHKGRGPFKPGLSKRWADEVFAPGQEELPTFMEEFGNDLIERLGRPGEYYGSAVRSADKIKRWFSEAERTKLHKLGYRLVSMKADRVLAESSNQIVFARRRPLYRDVRTASLAP